jgi:hypothetical protein
MRRVLPAIIGAFLLFLNSPSLPVAAEQSASQQPAYVALYEQGKLEEAAKELDGACAGKTNEDTCKIWNCLLELEKAAIMKERGEGGYEKIAFDKYLILKPLLGRNGDNPDYWLAAAKSFALNNSPSRAKKALEKALYYRKDFPEARFIRIELGEESDPSAAYNDFLSLADSKGTPPSVSAKTYVRLAAIDYRKYQRNLNANTLDSTETLRKRNAALKKKVTAFLEKAIAVAPESAYRSIAEEQIGKIGAD